MPNDVLDNGEILKDDAADKALKQDLDNLAKDINVKESSSDKVDALFTKLDSVDPEAKNRALQYALKNAKIMVGNTEKSIAEISTSFDNAVEQDNGTWKIKLKDDASQEDKELVEGFLNEKGSSLAYLIQLSSQKASLQASRGYGRNNADGLIDVKDDKVFGNQTRRALSGLREWIEGDYTKDVESLDVKKMSVDDVLKLKFISKSLKEKIENDAEDEKVKNIWSNEEYELKNKYTNNFALKKRVITVDNPKWEGSKKYVESKVGDKMVKSYTISSLDELPDGYKWKDPENYDVSNKDTYPKIYVLFVDNVKYSFYSNGRCHNAADNKMYNTKDIVEKLKKSKGVEQSENHDEGEDIQDVERYEDRKAILEIVQKSKDDFKIKDLNGKEYVFQASLGQSTVNNKNIQFEIKGKNGGMSGAPTIASFELNCGKLLDRNTGKFKKDYWENEILPDIKVQLKSQIDAYTIGTECVNQLTTYYWDQKTLFPDVTEDDVQKYGQLKRYFVRFGGKFEFDKTDTKFKDGKIYLQIDNSGINYSYHRAENNKNLIVDPMEFCNASGKFSITKTNKKIRSIIEGIIEEQNI